MKKIFVVALLFVQCLLFSNNPQTDPDYEKAFINAQQMLEINRELNDRNLEARALLNIRKGSLMFSILPTFQHFNIPTFQHSNGFHHV